MDISVTQAEDKASGVKFCTVVIGVLGRESHILGDFAQNRPVNRLARALNYKDHWKEPSLDCRPRLTEVRATFYL